MKKYCDISDLLGKTLVNVKVTNDGTDIDSIKFECSDGSRYEMYHEQDCCENVEIEDICGELHMLIGNPILLAEEVVNEGIADNWGTETWTFYKLATIAEYVTIRWYGESNGYYSETVDFIQVKEGEL